MKKNVNLIFNEYIYLFTVGKTGILFPTLLEIINDHILQQNFIHTSGYAPIARFRLYISVKYLITSDAK